MTSDEKQCTSDVEAPCNWCGREAADADWFDSYGNRYCDQCGEMSKSRAGVLMEAMAILAKDDAHL